MIARLRKKQPSIVVVTVHKGASSFIADEFSSAVKKALPQLQIVRFGSLILKGATADEMPVPAQSSMFVRVYPNDIQNLVVEKAKSKKLDSVKLVLLYRDPRDAAVSLYFSAAYSHSLAVPDADRFLTMRERLQDVSETEGVRACSQPAINEFKQILALAEQYPGAFVSSYEEMVADYDTWLSRFRKHVGWSGETEAKIASITGDPFIPPAEVDKSQHRRRITPGNWKEVFDDELREHFENHCGAQMKACGYTW